MGKPAHFVSLMASLISMIVVTSIIHALSIEFTATPHVLSTTPVHVTPTPIISTIPSQTSSVGSSHRRCRSPVTLVTTTAHTPTALAPARADLFSIRKRFRCSAFDYETSVEDGMEAAAEADVRIDVEDETYTEDYHTYIMTDITADFEAHAQVGVEAEIEVEVEESDGDTIKNGVDSVYPKPDTLVVFPVSTIVVRLVEHEEAIQGMCEHLVEMPTQRLEEIKEELRVQRERAEVVEAERNTLRAMVRSLGGIKMRLRGTIRDEREARARIERHLGLVQEELRQSRMSHRQVREDFRRLEDSMISQHGYHP
ncbi:hypothetical protein Tco_0489103 [Tanacetum coccineum]